MRAPDSFRPRCLPVDAWPLPYRRTWLRALHAEDLFGPVPVAPSWRPATLVQNSKGDRGLGLVDPAASARSGLDRPKLPSNPRAGPRVR